MEHPGPASVNQLSSSSLNATMSWCDDQRMSKTSDTHAQIHRHTQSYTANNILIFISDGTTLGWTPP